MKMMKTTLISICILLLFSSCKDEVPEQFIYAGPWNAFADPTHETPAYNFTYFYDQGVELFPNQSFTIRYYNYDNGQFTSYPGTTGEWDVKQNVLILSFDTEDKEDQTIEYILLEKSTNEIILGIPNSDFKYYLVRGTGL